MFNSNPISYQYQVGGGLPSNAPSYVTRKADEEVYQALKAGEFCYVLNARQVGKSSLRVRVAQRLQAEGFVCVNVDLSGIGNRDSTPNQWYADIMMRLVRGLKLSKEIKLLPWLNERKNLSPINCLGELLQDVLLEKIDQSIVIFFDEIDSTLSLPFNTDDFFALLRSCHEYEHLTFTLLGVATPSDLIADKIRTPFNIGRAIQLKGFELEEVQPLILGLKDKVKQPQWVMQEILNWTGGQPFLTQKLCQIMASDQSISLNTSNVKEIVESNIIDNWAAQDEPPHLRTIRDRLLNNEQRASRLLGLYQQILLEGKVIADDSPEQIELLLSGLVVKEEGYLQIYNRIYQNVFNLDWVEKQINQLRPYAEDFKAWVASNYQDEAYLLRGQALLDAQSWAKDKNLSNQDYRYLAASQEQEKRAVEGDLAISQKANQILTTAEKKGRKIIRIGSLMAAMLLGAAGWFALQTASQRRQVAFGEIKAMTLSSEVSFESHHTLDALLESLKAGIKLQEMGWNNADPDLKIRLEKALSQSLYWIRERNRLEGHEDVITRVKYSPDGQTLATASWDKTLKIWQPDGTLLHTLKGHSDAVWSVNYSPNGEYLVSASRDKTAKIWRVKDGQELTTLKVNQDWVACVGFSSDGQIIATMGWHGIIYLWNLQGELITSFPTHKAPVVAIHVNPQTKMVATASRDGTAKIWNFQGQELATLRGHQDWVMYVNFSLDGQTLITGSKDKTARLWDLKGNELATMQGHTDTVGSAVFSRDGQTIATAGFDQTVRLWNRQGKLLQTLQGHTDAVWGVNFNNDDSVLASSGEDGTVRLWSLKDKAHNAQSINLLNLGDTANVSVSLSANGKVLGTAGRYTMAKLWDLEGNQLAVLNGHGDNLRSIHFSPTGDLVVTASRDKTAKIWNLQGQLIATLEEHQGDVRDARFSPNGQLIATASWDTTAKIWDVTGKELLTLKGHQGVIRKVSFSPDSQLLATASEDGTAKVWNLQGKALVNLQGHQDGVLAVAFSPDGQIIATASKDKTVKLWNLQGQELKTLQGHEQEVNDLSLSPNGYLIATASEDGTIKLWTLQGEVLQTLGGHRFGVKSISFTPDGKGLISSDLMGNVILWQGFLAVNPDQLLTQGCAWVHDYLQTNVNLSSQERQLCDI
ncbi:WD40 domain-containing protein [Crocosphaera chwakensis]|uniref:WD-repeat protein n=1 Tax=Crocosphaera chwakensis CCY0110 TaxID=391612 RepID=A3IUX7_9CHRO|nr:AAA-like domain-containing protein [Crocosphaera chwakensis]EAZ89725.1 WD-repeat protein [Crocosphaera chwakensis CCY0110]